MKIKAYIFCWYGQYFKVKYTEKQLRNIFGDSLDVINTNSPEYEQHWAKLPDNYYFSWADQFMYAAQQCINGGYDAMLFVQGDVQYDNWDGFVNDALSDFEKYNWGVYNADQTNTPWISGKVDLKRFKDNNNLALVTCADTDTWFIHSDILHDLLDLNIDWGKYPNGWGIDWLVNIFSYIKGRPAIRNYKHRVNHPASRVYSGLDAKRQGLSMFKELKQIKPYISNMTISIEIFHKNKKPLPSFNNFNYNLY